MKIKKGLIYKDEDGDFYTPAMSGDFWIVDMWNCDKGGTVPDIEENTSPVPKNTAGLTEVFGYSKNYNYPEFNPRF